MQRREDWYQHLATVRNTAFNRSNKSKQQALHEWSAMDKDTVKEQHTEAAVSFSSTTSRC